MKKFMILTASALAFGCTDAEISQITNLGNSGHIKCYSGSKLIYEGRSTGKISSETYSDGYFFKEEGTGKLKEVSGNCDITYD